MGSEESRDPTKPNVPLPPGYHQDPGRGPLKNQGDRLEKASDVSKTNSDSDTAVYSGDPSPDHPKGKILGHGQRDVDKQLDHRNQEGVRRETMGIRADRGPASQFAEGRDSKRQP